MDRCTTIVVPCFNEAERLPLERFHVYLARRPEARLLFVDDGSRDATAGLLRRLARDHAESCTAISLQRNCGKAEAVRLGMRLALERGAPAVGYWDADLATPLAEIEDFTHTLRRRPDVTVVLGARLKLAGRTIRRHPLRNLLSAGCRYSARRVLHARLSDTQCGAKLFRATPVLGHALAWPFTSRWLFDVELLLRLQCFSSDESTRWFEQPLHAWSECGGSKVQPWDYVRALADLVRLQRLYRSRAAAEQAERRGGQSTIVSYRLLSDEPAERAA